MSNKSRLLVIAAGVAGLSFYWIHFYRGPHRWILEWQLKHQGHYSPELCVLIALFAAVACGIIAALAWVRPYSDIRIASQGLRRHRDWLRAHRFRVLFAGLSGYFLMSGLWQLTVSATLGNRLVINLSEIKAEAPLPSRWLCIEGQALTTQTVGFHDPSGSELEEYIPVVSAHWLPAQAVRCFLHNTSAPSPVPSGCFEGIVSRSTLPSQFVEEFHKLGIEPAAHSLILDWGETPSELRSKGVFNLILGVIMGALVLIVWKWRNSHA